MANILIVCTANICRSPVATALLRDRLQKRGYDDWLVSSAGTWAVAPRSAARNSILVMQEYGLDISDHISRMIDGSLLEDADLVLCMEEGHLEALAIEFPEQAFKIHPITAMAGPVYSVDDPYGGELVMYQKMAAELAGVIDRGMPQIIRLAELNKEAQ